MKNIKCIKHKDKLKYKTVKCVENTETIYTQKDNLIICKMHLHVYTLQLGKTVIL